MRTSIPQEIKEYLEIEFGDILEWVPDKKNGEKVVILRKLV
ncbi:MAG: hypothetical protein NDP22_00330 [Crenarchaeota archaeon]|nr:hypothetical protein [Thermoproteota archaeon]